MLRTLLKAIRFLNIVLLTCHTLVKIVFGWHQCLVV